jgi:general secretion pathway protein C
MRVALARKGLKLPRANPAAVAEGALITIVLLLAGRLAWTLFSPLAGAGEAPVQPVSRPLAVLGAFDPFFRMSDGAAGPAVVTALDLKLFGVRQDQVSGRGSAIIGPPSGTQRSIAVGEEVAPGVVLTRVDFDSVTIRRNGAEEQLFMDQPEGGTAAPAAPPQLAAPSARVASAAPAPVPAGLDRAIAFSPRMAGGAFAGLILRPQGDGAAFRAAGLQVGDVLVAVNGRRLRSAAEAGALLARAQSGRATFQVERDGRMTTVRPGSGR